VGNLRLVLDAVLSSGKQHTSGHAKAAVARLLDELGDVSRRAWRQPGGAAPAPATAARR
jgi:hypothetical protein